MLLELCHMTRCRTHRDGAGHLGKDTLSFLGRCLSSSGRTSRGVEIPRRGRVGGGRGRRGSALNLLHKLLDLVRRGIRVRLRRRLHLLDDLESVTPSPVPSSTHRQDGLPGLLQEPALSLGQGLKRRGRRLQDSLGGRHGLRQRVRGHGGDGVSRRDSVGHVQCCYC